MSWLCEWIVFWKPGFQLLVPSCQLAYGDDYRYSGEAGLHAG
jgi:hypothetical protein